MATEKQTLDLILNTNGGFFHPCSTMITALRCYRKKGGTVKSIIYDKAYSSGTRVTFESNKIMMSCFATVSPCDTQITSSDGTFSAKDYKENNDWIKKNKINLELKDIMLLDCHSRYYEEDSLYFKSSKQYEICPKGKKQRFLDLFLNRRVHAALFTRFDLTERFGLFVNDIDPSYIDLCVKIRDIDNNSST